MIKLALLTTDNREQRKRYDLEEPFFDAAQTALMEGFRGLSEKIVVHVISCSKRAMNGPSKLADNVYFHQLVVPHPGWGRSAFAGCALAVRRLLKEIKPDIVHGQGTERDCAISAVYSGFPNVITIHGNMQRIHRMNLLGSRSYYWLASKLETHALRRTAGVFCNSNHTRHLVEGRTRKTWLVPNPLRQSFLDSGASQNRRNQIPVFLVIGVVTRLKRPLEILQSLQRLFDAGKRFQVRFVGALSTDRSYSNQFMEHVERAKEQGFAEFSGTLDEAALRRAMDEADALIHFPQEEAFGLVVAEALARDLKVFAARIGGIPDILEGTDGSEMFEDFSMLEQGIARWIDKGCPRPSGNPALMRERYAPEVIARRHLGIYREVLGR
jgi:glycosyltransferase involved in cell wall biosynthesis